MAVGKVEQEPKDDYEAFFAYEQEFCDTCGEHLMKHGPGSKCPDTRNEFVLEVKRRKQRRYRIE